MWEKQLERKIPEESQVQAITLDDLFERKGVERIDFFSIDINGAQPLARNWYFTPEGPPARAEATNRSRR
jgi:hypothetical protein